MLELKQVVKDYPMTNNVVHALKGIDLQFRENEFVAILGPSGCGKTTLLNIIGGLDRYTSGDLVINGISTKEYKDKDWDKYRNHKIGFVFQTYNLIHHQTVLENVELALTLSGVSREERKKRATDVLIRVGLGDKVNGKPNQLSGGQMQRVAIARALINDPDILLADEPTGALDTATSVQVMEILQEVAKDKLVIMVTHNPALAEKYSTRIIKLLDGEVVSDSSKPERSELNTTVTRDTSNKTSMSFFTALSLSFKNLMTKKTRTILISFAGSIGIIGIALILALSSGFQNYINRVQGDSLSNYPVSIENETTNLSSLTSITSGWDEFVEFEDVQEITNNRVLSNMLETYTLGTVQNDLTTFNEYLVANVDYEKINGIQYTYDTELNLYKQTEDGYTQINDMDLSAYMGDSGSMGMFSSYLNCFSEMMDNAEFIKSQYDLRGGYWWDDTENLTDDENTVYVMLVISSYNTLTDYMLYNLGIRTNNIDYTMTEMRVKAMRPDLDTDEITDYMENTLGMTYDESEETEKISFSELLNLEYKMLTTADLYKATTVGDTTTYANVYQSNPFTGTLVCTDADYVNNLCSDEDAVTIKIAGILRAKEGVSGCLSNGIAYPKDLTEKIVERTDASAVVTAQKADESINVFTGLAFAEGYSAEQNYTTLGVIDLDKPSSILIYPTTFENKDYIVEFIDQYNEGKTETEKITYTDTLGIMISSITEILNAISIVLMAFVSISLVVSSIMISVITNISVLERTKEIGVLRSVGASKRDISRVFNAETTIIGFSAGLLGIAITLLLTIPVNIIIESLAGIAGVASLPLLGAVILIAISVVLTLIAGLIPARKAANLNPVEALRSE